MSGEPFVIIGGGVAGARAIEAIRENDTETPVILVAREKRLPYERPPLSKEVLLGVESPEAAFVRPVRWYDERGVDLRLGVAADKLDPASRSLVLSDGQELTWGAVLLATGSGARKLEVPGTRLGGVFYLRTMTDAAALRERLVHGSRVVVVGAGWIGLEVSAAARRRGAEVTVIEPHDAPLLGTLGERIGAWFADVHRSHEVTFRFADGVESLEGEGDVVTTVVTTGGDRLPADTVVIGIGAFPNTRLAEGAGLDVEDGILVDESLRASADGVYAAGDVARWYHPTLRTRVRVEHWANAYDGGYAAGRSMVGLPVHYGPMPFFYSDQYDLGLEYAGYVPPGTDTELVLRGDPASNEFLAFWVGRHGDDARVLAGMQVHIWDEIDTVQALVRSKGPVDLDRLADPTVALDAVGANELGGIPRMKSRYAVHRLAWPPPDSL
ncbi:MAG: FAD-dependent oxidoreductase [Intrasporangium sp.]|uniref:NAD(P)/FAD-dependent oxidoreductase n=1 Tax=Intrasporangium sp. TaxID=1925024 RepID=UPI0026479283|nr:FAD-dependent oxidoreductase [Intrasporangium sp.]MDN5794699.1 FAD-dependent oxidoreductase [Intrasporangium sp.]